MKEEEMQMSKKEYFIMILAATLFATAILGGLEIIRFYSLIVGLFFMISFLTASIIIFERQEKRLEDMGFFDDEENDDFYDEDDELDDEDDYVDLSLSSIISFFKYKSVDDEDEDEDYDDFDDEEDDFEYDYDEEDDEKTSSLAEIIDFPHRCFK